MLLSSSSLHFLRHDDHENERTAQRSQHRTFLSHHPQEILGIKQRTGRMMLRRCFALADAQDTALVAHTFSFFLFAERNTPSSLSLLDAHRCHSENMGSNPQASLAAVRSAEFFIVTMNLTKHVSRHVVADWHVAIRYKPDPQQSAMRHPPH